MTVWVVKQYDQLKEGEPVTFFGVHVLRWKREWGDPTVAITHEADDQSRIINRQSDAIDDLNKIVATQAKTWHDECREFTTTTHDHEDWTKCAGESCAKVRAMLDKIKQSLEPTVDDGKDPQDFEGSDQNYGEGDQYGSLKSYP